MTHEVGHWLNLEHTFQMDDCGAASLCTETSLDLKSARAQARIRSRLARRRFCRDDWEQSAYR